MHICGAEMGADILAGKVLCSDNYRQIVAVIDRQIQRATDKGIIDPLVNALRGFQNLALDEILLTETRVVVDAGRTENGVAVGARVQLPIPVRTLTRSAEIDPLLIRLTAAMPWK